MENINFYTQDQIGFLGLNRPQKRNALNKNMIEEIICLLNKLKADRSFKVLIIYGEGKHYCSGADLEWMKQGIDQTKAQNLHDAKLFNTLFESLNSFPVPVICEVQQSAFGGAVGLLACADIVVCEQNTLFGFPEVKLGIIPATIAPYVLAKMGNSNTRKRLLMAEPFSAQEAMNEGLIHFITDKQNIRTTTLDIARKITLGAPNALIQTKALIHRLEETTDDEASFLFCARIIANARTSSEGLEGVTAFLEKRKPAWNNE